MKNKIFVDRGIVAANSNYGLDKPPVVVQNDCAIVMKAHEIQINGPSIILYKSNEPLRTEESVYGTVRCWIETDSEVIKVR